MIYPDGKRYLSFSNYMTGRFGRKCAKIPLDAGFTCPNIDGTCGIGGCIYCLGGTAAVTATAETVPEQYAEGIAALQNKWGDGLATVPYLQAHTNTYANPEHLRELYSKCAELPGAVMLAIATRADCLSDEVIGVIRETADRIPVLVELGLQTASDRTAELINRGHTAEQFIDGYTRLRNAGGDIAVCIHMINGLPGETREDMLNTARFTAYLKPDMVKLHLLHVLRGTELCRMYECGEYTPMEREDYINTVVDQLELMPPDTVIARLTGDGAAADLAAPDWSRRKISVLNNIDKELRRRDSFQGCRIRYSDPMSNK